MSHLVAGDVLAMMGELGGEASKRTLVYPDAEALDDLAGHQAHRAQLPDDLRVQILKL